MKNRVRIIALILVVCAVLPFYGCSSKIIEIDTVTRPNENDTVHQENEIVDTEIVIPDVDDIPEDTTNPPEQTEPTIPEDIEIIPPSSFEFQHYKSKLLQDSDELKLYNAINEGLKARANKITIPIMQSDIISDIYEFVRLDNPQFFYAPTNFKIFTTKINGSVAEMEIEFLYSDTWTIENISSARRKINNAASEILKNLTVIDGDYNKILYLYKFLTKNIEYKSDNEMDYSIYGALVNNRATCEGFSEALQYLLLLSDINCISVVGESKEQPHEWNMVKVDGEWYYFDVTWDSPTNTTKYLPYNYFALTLNDISASHIVYYSPYLPEANNIKYNYYVYNNLVLNNYSEPVLIEIAKRSFEINPGHITFKTIDRDVLTSVTNNIHIWLPKVFKELGITNNQISYMTNDTLNIIDIVAFKEEK